jgi:hypothetical protein
MLRILHREDRHARSIRLHRGLAAVLKSRPAKPRPFNDAELGTRAKRACPVFPLQSAQHFAAIYGQ